MIASTFFVLALAGAAPPTMSLSDRLDDDAASGTPLTARVIVALADNEHQGIAPVPAALGDGNAPRTNLYWGARYGLATFLVRDAGWTLVSSEAGSGPVLRRAVFERRGRRNRKKVTLRIEAEAWRGAEIKKALTAFLTDQSNAPIVVYVGHNGLMDFAIEPAPRDPPSAKSEMVFACASAAYFADRLDDPQLLTTGLLAPEGYAVEAALRAAFEGRDAPVAAGRAYARYQKCSPASGRALFIRPPRREGKKE